MRHTESRTIESLVSESELGKAMSHSQLLCHSMPRKKLVNASLVVSEEQLRWRKEKRMMREYRKLLYESGFGKSEK